MLAVSILKNKIGTDFLFFYDAAAPIVTKESIDMDNAKKNGMSEALLDRLLLTKERLEDMAVGISKTDAQYKQ